MKNKFMKKIVGTLLGLLLLIGCAQIFVSAQSDNIKELGIVGVFRTNVTQRNCQTGAPLASFPGLLTFNKGGTLAETSAGSNPALRGPGHGVWRRESGFQEYSTAFTFFRFNADGTFAGSTVIRQTTTLAPGGNQLSSTGFVEIYNANGNLLGTGCATSTGTRFE